ncbi:hypothetical protein [Priestia megaterium]|uniref:Uncharacterized protein n=1 Tax=Priestia megaterium TaxID=1404 RepID=A0A6M6DZR3_PRIMG|nr:hypothetical protein [Priestia megaterium]QJX80090.1 hypothetical protein FDZ14_28760 [Priestia megaterium]
MLLKKRYLLVGAAVPLLILNGCSIGDSTEQRDIPVEKIDMSRYASKTAEGIFDGVLNTKFVDIKINGEVKIFTVSDKALKQLGDLNEGDQIQFVYSLNEKTIQNELQSVTQVNGQEVETVTEEQKPVKDNLDVKKKVKKENEIEMEVEYPTTTKIVGAVKSDFIKGKFNVIDTYDWNDQTLDKGDTEVRFHTVVDTIEDDIQKERWRAADILKEVGELHEKKESNRDGVKFIFYAENDNEYKEIMVVKNKYGYLRVETDTPYDEKEDTIAEVTAMLDSIE